MRDLGDEQGRSRRPVSASSATTSGAHAGDVRVLRPSVPGAAVP
ncbi:MULTISPECIES: hypothetical protein [Micromonospora]|nr:hypothetical protein [Micromonospora veneta]